MLSCAIVDVHVLQSIGELRRPIDKQMMQSLSAKVLSHDWTPSLASLVMSVDGVKYQSLSVGFVIATYASLQDMSLLLMPISRKSGMAPLLLQITADDIGRVIHSVACKNQESYQEMSEHFKRLGVRIKTLTGQVCQEYINLWIE